MAARSEPGMFRTDWPDAPDTFSLGCVTVSGLRGVPGRLYYSVGHDADLVCRIEEDGADGNPGSWFWLAADARRSAEGFGPFATFASRVAFYRQDENAFRLPSGRKFGPELLAVETPDGWRHDAFQTRAGSGFGRAIIHTYESDSANVLIRYMRDDAGLADHPCFHAINRGLRIVPGQWATHATDLDVRPAADERAEVTPAPARLLAGLTDSTGRSRRRLGLSADASPEATIDAIAAFVEGWIAGKRRPPIGRDPEDVANQLGCLWGQCVCDAFGWSWLYVARGQASALAVANPDRSLYVPPVAYLRRQLQPSKGSADVSVALLFNMICQGAAGPARPGELKQLG